MKIYVGQRFNLLGQTFEVRGNFKIRGTYGYIIRPVRGNELGEKQSIRREILLDRINNHQAMFV